MITFIRPLAVAAVIAGAAIGFAGAASADPPSGSYTGTMIDGAGVKKNGSTSPATLTPAVQITPASTWGQPHESCTCRATPTPGRGSKRVWRAPARSIAARSCTPISVWHDSCHWADQKRLSHGGLVGVVGVLDIADDDAVRLRQVVVEPTNAGRRGDIAESFALLSLTSCGGDTQAARPYCTKPDLWASRSSDAVSLPGG